jgi:hypothetical protein
LRPPDAKADLGVLARARIYFGHQSVGGDVLEGLAALAAKKGASLRIIEAPLDDGLPGVVHAKVGRNRAPETKCDAFGRFLTGQAAVSWDAAMLKFCYADMGEGGERDPRRLLAAYRDKPGRAC